MSGMQHENSVKNLSGFPSCWEVVCSTQPPLNRSQAPSAACHSPDAPCTLGQHELENGQTMENRQTRQYLPRKHLKTQPFTTGRFLKRSSLIPKFAPPGGRCKVAIFGLTQGDCLLSLPFPGAVLGVRNLYKLERGWGGTACVPAGCCSQRGLGHTRQL